MFFKKQTSTIFPFVLKAFILLLSFGSTSLSAYTDVEFAFKVAAERRVKEKITEFLSQSLPVEDFRVSVSASVFALEQAESESTNVVPEVPNAFTDDDPQDLALGVVQARDMKEALQGRDQLIEKLRKDLERAKAPLHQGVEILQMSVWLALKDTYTPQVASKIRDDLSAFVTDTYRITPKVAIQQLKQENLLNGSEQVPERTLASEDKMGTDLPLWIYVLLGVSVLLSIIALAGKSRTRISEKEIIHKFEPQENPTKDNEDSEESSKESHDSDPTKESLEMSMIADAGDPDVDKKLEQTLDSLSSQLNSAKATDLKVLVQYWAENGGHANHKVAVILKTWAELKPSTPLDCSLGAETLEAFTTWKDLSKIDQLKISSEALWELSAVASVGTKILGSKLSRLSKFQTDKIKMLIEKTSKQEVLYVVWSLLADSQRQDVLKKISHKDRAKLFGVLWAPSLDVYSDSTISEVESLLDAVSTMSAMTKGSDPAIVRKSFIISLDVRSEVEILWPELKTQATLVDDIKRDVFNLSTMAYVKDEFWTLPDLVPSEDEFVAMAKLLGKEAYGYILAAMPSLTRHIYEGVLTSKLKPENMTIFEEDYEYVEAYIARVRSDLKSQNMKVSDLMQSEPHWSLANLGSSVDRVMGAGNGSEAA